jgi:hypothetical protein
MMPNAKPGCGGTYMMVFGTVDLYVMAMSEVGHPPTEEGVDEHGNRFVFWSPNPPYDASIKAWALVHAAFPPRPLDEALAELAAGEQAS